MTQDANGPVPNAAPLRGGRLIDEPTTVQPLNGQTNRRAVGGSVADKWAELQRVAPNTYANTMSRPIPGSPAPQDAGENDTAATVQAVVEAGSDEDLSRFMDETAKYEQPDYYDQQLRAARERSDAQQFGPTLDEQQRAELQRRMMQGDARDRSAAVAQSIQARFAELRRRQP